MQRKGIILNGFFWRRDALLERCAAERSKCCGGKRDYSIVIGARRWHCRLKCDDKRRRTARERKKRDKCDIRSRRNVNWQFYCSNSFRNSPISSAQKPSKQRAIFFMAFDCSCGTHWCVRYLERFQQRTESRKFKFLRYNLKYWSFLRLKAIESQGERRPKWIGKLFYDPFVYSSHSPRIFLPFNLFGVQAK